MPLIERSVLFARRLRDAGLRVTTGQIALFLESLALIDLTDRNAFHDVARAAFVSDSQEINAFEAAFTEFWFAPHQPAPPQPAPFAPPTLPASPTSPAPPPSAPSAWTSTPEAAPTRASREPPSPAGPAGAADAAAAAAADAADAPSPPGPADAVDRRRTWSATEILRHKRFDQLAPDEAQHVQALMRRFLWRLETHIEQRRTRRFRRASHGPLLDWRRMVQRAVRDQGEWLERRWRVRRTAPRPLVVLADISGSMEGYARMLLSFVHALTQPRWEPPPERAAPRRAAAAQPRAAAHRRPRVEAFVFATRLTRITRALHRPNANLALADAAAHIVDWAGGTRIGDSLHTFNQLWARRVLRHGAIVLIISDAWDRGDPERLAREVDRLHRSCHRLVWLNPLIATEGFEPRTRGLLAALPFVDDFLPAHNLSSLEALAHHLAPELARPLARRSRPRHPMA